MKKFLFVFIALLLVLTPLCTAGASAAAEGELTVYPHDPFALYGAVEMTPNGGFLLQGRLGSSQTLYSFAVTNDFSFDYDAAHVLLLSGFEANCHVKITADFYDTLDGYSYPETVVCDLESAEKNDLSFNLKEILSAANKWEPDGMILYLMITVDHAGEESKFAAVETIRLVGEGTPSTRECSAEAISISVADAEASNFNVTLAPTTCPEGFELTKQDYLAAATLTVADITSSSSTPYIYICFKEIPSNNWPYLYIREGNSTVAGGAPKLVRIRPEMGVSTAWMRIDLSCLSSPDAPFDLQIYVDTPAGASTLPLVMGGIFLGDEKFSDDTSIDVPSGGGTEESEVSVPKNEPADPNKPSVSEPAAESAATSETSEPVDNSKRDAIIRYVCAGVLVVALTILVIHMVSQKKKNSK